MKSVQPEDILAFWFSEEAQKRWFQSTDAFDATIRMRFENTAMQLASTTASRPHAWEAQSPQAHLALIIALDQFPRNMYRDTPAAFAWDGLALGASKRLIAMRRDLKLSMAERPFAYMPLMHSENIEDQNECVRLCDSRLETDNTLKFAIIHRDIIEQFGRFPHRNAVLGREMTPEEQAFLDDGGFSA